MSDEEEPTTDTRREQREDRFARNMRENEQAKHESANVLRSVAETLENAAKVLRKYGEEPFKDLEH